MHEAIQDAVSFDNDHLFDFFVGRQSGNRAYSIGRTPSYCNFNPVKIYRGETFE
ncbi:MAG: hypothetical protein GY834_02040 [Bacteroidetes bacterium]|nr:hypothetical protein [Bacteroidota bacterium]